MATTKNCIQKQHINSRQNIFLTGNSAFNVEEISISEDWYQEHNKSFTVKMMAKILKIDKTACKSFDKPTTDFYQKPINVSL